MPVGRLSPELGLKLRSGRGGRVGLDGPGDRAANPVGGAVETSQRPRPRSAVASRPDAAIVEFMGDDPEVDLAETFAEVARTLLAEDDAQATLERIVRLAVDTIDGCEHAGITVIERGEVTSPASSDE